MNKHRNNNLFYRSRCKKNELRSIISDIQSRSIEDIPLKKLVGYGGYAQTIAQKTDITRVQLRKFFNNFRRVVDFAKSKKIDELEDFYELQIMVEYQAGRKAFGDECFHELAKAVLENIEKNPSERNLDRAEMFIKAIVAYSKQQ